MNDYTEYAVTELQKLFEEHQREMISQVYSKVEEYVSGFLSENVRLRAELDAEREKNRWIPCSERLPDSLDVVMVNITEVDGSPVMDMAYYNSNDSAAPYNGWQTNYFMVFGKVTHWRPLPEPPECEP